MPSIINTICEKSKRLLLVWVFFAKIVAFAIFYWITFTISPDTFNFTNGYNSNPLTAFWSNFYEADDPSSYAARDNDDTLAIFVKAARKLENKYEDMRNAEDVTKLAKLAYDKHVKEQIGRIEKSIDSYEKVHIFPLRKRTLEIDKLVDDPAIAPSKKVKLIEEKIRLLKELEKQLNHIAYNRSSFINKQDAKLERELYIQEEIATKSEFEIAQKYREQRGNLADQYSKTRSELSLNVGFLDFLYFSACISTTTTFGDITANQQWLRIIVILQILSGIVILGIAIDRLKS